MSDTSVPLVDGRAPTGILGLDVLLAGGIPINRLHLIEGDPGTGKTTMALQFLLDGQRRGESCLYVTLSETAVELRAVAASHGWSLDGIELCELAPSEAGRTDEQYTLYHPAEIELGQMVKNIIAAADRVQPSRVVVDSLSELRLLARDSLRYRRQILALKEFFATRQSTVVVLDDHTSGTDDLQLRSIAHSVVLLEQEPFEYGRSRRRLRIIKVRGVAAIEGFHDFKIRRGGIEVFPQLVPDTHAIAPTTPILSGIAELDDLIGGGLSWGTCTLFIGPAGVGKSSVAAQYVTATAGESPAAVYLFDERRSIFIQRCEALGMSIGPRLKSGHLTLEQVEPGDMSPGEFAHRVYGRVKEQGCRIVLIDSLNGYLNAIPSGHSPLVRMHELLAFLNDRKVATLVVAAQHGVLGSYMASPIDVSYLADCVVLLRFFEAQGRIRKAISVVKKRTGRHETAIRELSLETGAIRVGEPLTDFQGVMTGVPQYRGDTAPLVNRGTTRD